MEAQPVGRLVSQLRVHPSGPLQSHEDAPGRSSAAFAVDGGMRSVVLQETYNELLAPTLLR